jgi:GNAT superfamily N-acetyltransferase
MARAAVTRPTSAANPAPVNKPPTGQRDKQQHVNNHHGRAAMPGRWRSLPTMSVEHDVIDAPKPADVPKIVDAPENVDAPATGDPSETVDDHTVDSTVLARREDGYEIDTDRARLDVPRIEHWLATDSYWAYGRAPGVTRTAIANSVCFGVYAAGDQPGGGEQVAFARVVTDHATFAWLSDVYVARNSRGLGLGTWLAQVAVKYTLDQGLPRLVLATRDAHGVYVKAGFAPVGHPDRWMEIDLRPTTQPD